MISYVNTTAAVKAVTDVVVTSTNAKQIVESFPADEKIIFGPDRNLGNYINSITGRNMLLWDGACHVHEQFSVEKILELKKQYPDAAVLVHPECKGAVSKLADKVASTAGLLKYAIASDKKDFIVATESGILHEMRKKCPEKNFIPAPPEDSTCACNECNFMRLNTLEKLYNTLKYEWPEVTVDEAVAKEAVKPIKKMLEIDHLDKIVRYERGLDRLLVKGRESMSFVDIQDIVLVQRENNSTVIYTRQDSFTTSAGLGDIEAKLDQLVSAATAWKPGQNPITSISTDKRVLRPMISRSTDKTGDSPHTTGMSWKKTDTAGG